MDSTAQTAYRHSQIINELLERVTQGFDSLTTLRDSKIINELLSRETHRLYSANSP
jgi:hypothetical protein